LQIKHRLNAGFFFGKHLIFQNKPSLNEEYFIYRLKARDPSAFQELVEQFRDRVYNTALGLLQDNKDAEDMAQEIFLEVYQSIPYFRGASKISTWIYRITVQKSLEFIRKQKRKKRSATLLSLFGKENLIPVPGTSPFFHPGIQLENKERAAILFDAIKKLPVKQRMAFTLNKVEDLGYAEIAEIMKVSLSSVESLLFRARQNLRKILAGYYVENER